MNSVFPSVERPLPVVPKPRYRLSLAQQILLSLVVGVVLGAVFPSTPGKADWWQQTLVVVRDIFLHLIKALIAPLIFASIVQGVAGTGDMKKVGRIGAKALLYFEIVTTAALAVGLCLANI